MSRSIFTKLNIFEKAFMLWFGVAVLFMLISSLTGYWPSWKGWWWWYYCIAIYLAEEIWRTKIEELKRRMQELEDRIHDLETRIPKAHPLANPQS